MTQPTPPQGSASSQMGERLAAFVREHIQRVIQPLVAAELAAVLGRPTSARRATVDAPQGLRHGDGKPQRLQLRRGTITGRRPRVRGRGARVVSRVLPLLQRRTWQLGEVWPPRYWHGLALPARSDASKRWTLRRP